MLSVLPIECWKTIICLRNFFCVFSSPVGHRPGGSLATLQHNGQLKDEVQLSFLVVLIAMEEKFPGRTLLQNAVFEGKKYVVKSLLVYNLLICLP